METFSVELQGLIQNILQKLITDYRPQKVILFGSHAYGTARPDSDLDLLIIKETSARLIDRWVEVRRILSDPERRLPVETLVLTPTEVSQRLKRGDQFIAQILKEGRVLYAA